MTDQPRPVNSYPTAAAGSPPPPNVPGARPGDYPASPPPMAPPPAAPPSRSRRNGLLFGCLAAGLLALLLGLAAAGGALFLVRRTTTRAQRALGTSVATTAAQPTVAPAAGGAGLTATGTAAVASRTGQAVATSVPVPGAAGAPAAPTSRPAAAHPAGLNQPVAVPNWTVTVTGVERPGQLLTWSADSGNDPAAATGTWVVVVLTATRTANGSEGVGYDDVALRSGQGFTYAIPEEFWTLDNFYPAFTHSQPLGKVVPPGATVTYYLAFDVAADATDLQFIFLPDSATPAVIAIGGAGQ